MTIMVLSIFTSSQAALGVCFVVVFVAVTAFVTNRRQRDIILDRLYISRRRSSSSKTPPRSLSPETTEKPKPTTGFAATPPGLVEAFPPSRQETLSELTDTHTGDAARILQSSKSAVTLTKQNALPMTRSYYLPNEKSRYTPTGFSTEQIKAMGNFPRYDVLSGVPLPEVYQNFQYEKALPRPYRPLRFPYHQTMSITKLEPDWWLELHNTYKAQIAERQCLFRVYGNKMLDYLPGSELACKELMEMALQFYIARYPALFSLSDDKKTFINHLLDTTTNLSITHPLHVLLNNVPEDFAIVLRNETDGEYYFRAGVICSSLGWNVSTKIGKNLKEIHTGIVPDYKEKMSFSMDRFFSKMSTDAAIQRGSWGMEIGEVLFMPPGDPHEALRAIQSPDVKLEDCNLRVDWQTLRRLPLSAGVVFNFTALFTPVTEFRNEPGVPALLARILREGKKNLMEYKGTWHIEHVVLPALDVWAAEQIENGMVRKDWEIETLGESPWFKGWEEKWHRQQGF